MSYMPVVETDDNNIYIVRERKRVALPKSEVSKRVLRICDELDADKSREDHELFSNLLRNQPTNPYEALRSFTYDASKLPLSLQEYFKEEDQRSFGYTPLWELERDYGLPLCTSSTLALNLCFRLAPSPES